MQFSLFNYKINGRLKLVASVMLSLLWVINANAQSNIYPAEGDARITNGKLLLQRNGTAEQLTLKDITYGSPLEFGFGTQSDGLYLSQNGTPKYHFRTDGNFLVKSGKIGIGTFIFPDIPQGKLHVDKNEGENAASHFITLRDKSYDANNPFIYNFTGMSDGLYMKSSSSNIYFQLKANAGVAILKIPAGGSEPLLTLQDMRSTVNLSYNFSTDVDGLKIKQGTSSYHFKTNGEFIVAGPIHAREVQIFSAAGGPDFVFNDNYPLPSLAEVEKFIKANKHLPDIASAKEMETNGIELGKMDMKLLQKVEELTLYIIDLQKQINLVKEENGQLKSQLGELKERQR